MSRVIVLCQRPLRVSHVEAAEWIRRELRPLEEHADVVRVSLTELRRMSLRWGGQWDWLIEIQLHGETKGDEPLGEAFFGSLLADLRLLGMRPAVAVADAATPLVDNS